MRHKIIEFLKDILSRFGIVERFMEFILPILLFVLLIILGLIVSFISGKIISKIAAKLVHKSKAIWDDILYEQKFFKRLAWISGVIVVYKSAPWILIDNPALTDFTKTASLIAIVIICLSIINSFLNSLDEIYNTLSVSKLRPVKGYVQVTKIISYLSGGILIISIALNKSPIYILGGLGALTALLLLIFKDPILGFVSGIQLSSNDMLRPGDWIEMSKYGADGEVMEINLTTVKVRNWDKTISTIPTYALVSDSFKNWRGMEESGGRRIKRSVDIDLSTIKFCNDEMLIRFERIHLISTYIKTTRKELDQMNQHQYVDLAIPVNGLRLTNIGCFRKYVEEYMKSLPQINLEMHHIVRQLAPNKNGLPIELYCFCKEIEWEKYEAFQSDVFDHILAIVPYFDLKVFQDPSGNDFRELRK
jgi:miniconductance mechanosensitive channel